MALFPLLQAVPPVIDPLLLNNPAVNTGLFGTFLMFLASVVVWYMRTGRQDTQDRIKADQALVVILTKLDDRIAAVEKRLDRTERE